MFGECNAGPFKVNGVPLRRVNQAYVIATSTKIDISSVEVAKYSDSYFKREVAKKKKGESEFFEAEKDVSVRLTEMGLVGQWVRENRVGILAIR
jgi:large subunit ribosomal protein L6e